MKTSENGIALIQKHEQLRLQSYLCPGGKWTIGWGSTSGVTPGMAITWEEATRRLRQDLTATEEAVRRQLTVAVNQNQFDALVSLMFNIGPTAFAGSTVRKLINTRKPADQIAASWKLWKKGRVRLPDGTTRLETLGGLVRRRQEEVNLYTS